MLSFPEVIDAVRPSVLQIAYRIEGLNAEQLADPNISAAVARSPGVNTLSGVLGTGFIVDEEAHVVTAKHVLDGARKLAADYPNTQVIPALGLGWANTESMRSNFFLLGFEILEEDERNDLALLRAAANPFKGAVSRGIVINGEPLEPLYGVASLREERPRDGDPIAVSGYPLSESVLVTGAGTVASAWAFVTEEVPHPAGGGLTVPHVRDIYLGDLQSNPGNSGGPVFSMADGSVVGVLVGGRMAPVFGAQGPIPGLRADAGISIVVPARYVAEMLDRHGISWVRAT